MQARREASSPSLAKWQLICEQGTRVSARSRASDIADPACLDVRLIAQYQSYALAHVVSSINGSASGLWFLLQIPSVFVPLVATRKSESIPCLLMR